MESGQWTGGFGTAIAGSSMLTPWGSRSTATQPFDIATNTVTDRVSSHPSTVPLTPFSGPSSSTTRVPGSNAIDTGGIERGPLIFVIL